MSRGVRRLRRLGVRSMFIAHWIDNAFAGPALQPGDNGTLIGFMQQPGDRARVRRRALRRGR